MNSNHHGVIIIMHMIIIPSEFEIVTATERTHNKLYFLAMTRVVIHLAETIMMML
jgi:hypothetical protein